MAAAAKTYVVRDADVGASRNRMARTFPGTLRAAIAPAIVALMICGCGVTGPDAAACKAAMQAQYVRATGGEGHFGAELAACKGLPKAEVKRFAQQILQGR